MKFEFRNFQVDDIARAAMHDGAILGWDPGLGKTVAAFTWPQLKDAKRTLIVAPEQLHQQIAEEAKRFGVTLRPLMTHEDFRTDKLLEQAVVEHANNQEISPMGWWLSSYSAISYNGGDQWKPTETENGVPVISEPILRKRRSHPLYREEDDYGIGTCKAGIRCVFTPSLATLVSHLFDCVVCDEAVRLKANESFISLGVRELNPRFRLVLTGTPIKNRLDDIFWLGHWACGGNAEPTARWPYPNSNEARETFAREHMIMERNHTREADNVARTGRYRKIEKRTPKICNVHRLFKLLGPVVLRRRKDMTGCEIVPKTIVPIRVKPGSAQQIVYSFHLKNPPEIAKNGMPMSRIAQVVAQLQMLRQAATCPDSPNLAPTAFSMQTLRALLKAGPQDNKTTDHKTVEAAVSAAEQMARNGKIDLTKLIKIAPSLEASLRPLIAVGESGRAARSWTDHNPKQAAILKLIQEVISKGEQIVIMVPFQEFGLALHRRLVEAGVTSCLLDGKVSPKKRGQLAKQFKKKRFSVLVGGIQSVGEGLSFEQCPNLILPSLDWAYDKNEQAINRVHRLNSPKPVTIYTMVMENTIDERLESVFRDKSESSQLALDGRLFADKTDEINLGELLREAIRNFDPNAETIDEKDIEAEWESGPDGRKGGLKQKLRIAEQQFREWHPPIVPDVTGYRASPASVAAAVSAAGVRAGNPMVSIVRCIPTATFAALSGVTTREKAEAVRDRFIEFCIDHPQFKDWRHAWKAFEAQPKAVRSPRRSLGEGGSDQSQISNLKSEIPQSQTVADAFKFLDNL
jgi:SNF2 family DNA or RNA helicase